MSREDVIRRLVGRELRKLHLSEEVVSEEDPELHELACEHFGTWETALQYAGIDRLEKLVRRQWDPEKVIEALQERQSRGLPMSGISQEDHGLYCACFRYFGGLKNALKAAGISRAE
jgi:hypothetical protein